MMARRPAAGFPDGGASDVRRGGPFGTPRSKLAPVRRVCVLLFEDSRIREKGSLLHRPPAGLLFVVGVWTGAPGQNDRWAEVVCVSRQAQQRDGPQLSRRIELFAAAAARESS